MNTCFNKCFEQKNTRFLNFYRKKSSTNQRPTSSSISFLSDVSSSFRSFVADMQTVRHCHLGILGHSYQIKHEANMKGLETSQLGPMLYSFLGSTSVLCCLLAIAQKHTSHSWAQSFSTGPLPRFSTNSSTSPALSASKARDPFLSTAHTDTAPPVDTSSGALTSSQQTCRKITCSKIIYIYIHYIYIYIYTIYYIYMCDQQDMGDPITS